LQKKIEEAMDCTTLRLQLEQIETLLAADPKNEAYLDLKNTLKEAIELSVEEIPLVAKHKLFHTILIGSRCEVRNEHGIWTGALLEVPEDETESVTVKLLHDGSTVTIPSTSVRPIKKCSDFDRTNLKIGLVCEARYSGDGKLYQGNVMQVTRNGCVVRFNKYNNQEEVAFEHLKVLEQVKEIDSSLSTAIAEIPKHLKVLSTDSEKIKDRKRQKLRALKKQTKRATKELEQEAKQQGWQSFQKKRKK